MGWNVKLDEQKTEKRNFDCEKELMLFRIKIREDKLINADIYAQNY